MTDLCYIILSYWHIFKPTCKALRELIKEKGVTLYTGLSNRSELKLDYKALQ
jgi:hypothetical protein